MIIWSVFQKFMKQNPRSLSLVLCFGQTRMKNTFSTSTLDVDAENIDVGKIITDTSGLMALCTCFLECFIEKTQPTYCTNPLQVFKYSFSLNNLCTYIDQLCDGLISQANEQVVVWSIQGLCRYECWMDITFFKRVVHTDSS